MLKLTHTYIGTFWNVMAVTTSKRVLGGKILCFGLCMFGYLLMPQLSHAQVTLSGTVYSDAGVTADGVARTIRVAVGTSTPGVFTTTSSVTTGAWTVTIPAGHSISTSTPILVWIDGDVTRRGQVLTKSNSSESVFSITDLDLYRDRVIVRHEATVGTSTTLSDFSFYTSVNDSDVQHSTSTGLLTITSGNELYIWAGKTFAPGSAVTVNGNATVSSTDGSMSLAGTAVYIAGGNLTLGGSLTAVSTATFTGGFHTIFFNATTTGKTITAPIPTIGNVTFSGVGGGWTFTSAATTSALTILRGVVTAPSTTLGVTGTFQNDATFTHNSGTVNIVGATTVALADIASFANGLDVSGSAGGASSLNITSFAVSGNALYVGQAGATTACSQTAGSAQGCELLVFNIASSSNPQYIAGRDSSGIATGTSAIAINQVLVSGTTLYAAKAASSTACTQVAGTAGGCELIVFDISSTTNPIFAAGRDADGTPAGTSAVAATGLAVSGSALYMSKAGVGGVACTTQTNCELMVFSIASTTNPLFANGLDVSGSVAGTQTLQINSLAVVGQALYVVKAGSGTPCSQVAGSALGCELMVFSIASTTNPVYTIGVDVNGSPTGAGNLGITTLLASGTALYLGTAASSNVCGQTTGLAEGCEIQMYTIASTTNPVFTRGVDVAGSYTGRQALGVNSFSLVRNYLYIAKSGNNTPCVQVTGFTLGCELLVFDVASSSAIRLIAGRDADGSATGTTATVGTAVIAIGNSVILGKAAAGITACSTGRLNCELIIFSASTTPSGLVAGTLSGPSAFHNVLARGLVQFNNVASVNSLTIASGTTSAPALLMVSGDYTNNGIFQANEGTLAFTSNSAQTLAGILIGTSSLYKTDFSGSGIKTIATNASSTFVTIGTGTTVIAPAQLTVADTFINNGIFTAGSGTLTTNGYLNGFLAGLSAGGNATDTTGITFNAFAQKDNYVYAVKSNRNTPCSQTAGLAQGCELMVFDVSSSTNPVYVAGRDVDGSTTGTGDLAMLDVVVVGNALYVAKAAAGTTACANTIGAGAAACELLVFDISTPTNPQYTKGLDATGSNAGTSTLAINRLLVSGSTLYAAKAASSTPCNQTAGLAGGCELMVFSIASTTNPVFVAGRDADGTAAGVTATAATGLAMSSSTLYLSKAAAGGAACTTQANCELMVFNVSSSTSPTYVTGIDVSGNAAGLQNSTINSIAVSGDALYAVKAGGGTPCSNIPGSVGAASCELMVFDISSTTNVLYKAGVDVSGSANTGSGNLALNNVVATGTLVYVVKAGSATPCSQIAGAALGCELMVFDVSSSTNPVYRVGRDTDGTPTGQSATTIQSVFIANDVVTVGKVSETTSCELELGLRTGCELMMFKAPTTMLGTLTGSSGFATVTTNGLTTMTAVASTTHLVVAASSKFTAPSTTLSVSGDITIAGRFEHNQGRIELLGTNQRLTNIATTTFYDFIQVATAAATTTFSTTSPFVILRNLNLSGAGTSTPLKLRSASSTAQWRIDPWSSSTVSLAFLDVRDANNISATTTPLVCLSGCIDRGNNRNWALGVQRAITGIVYADYGSTPLAATTSLTLMIDTPDIPTALFTVSTPGTGVYSFAISESLLTPGTRYLTYIDNDASNKASVLTAASSSDASISGLDLYRNFAIMRDEVTVGGVIDSGEVSFYNGANDSDIQYRIASGTLLVAADTNLVVWDGDNLSPGMPVSIVSVGSTTVADGSLFLQSGATYTAGGDTILGGSLRASSTAIIVPGVFTTTFTATTSGRVVSSPQTSLGNLTFSGAGGAWSFVSPIATTGDVTIRAGAVTAPSQSLNVAGVFTNNGTFNNNNGELILLGDTALADRARLLYLAGQDIAGSAVGTTSQTITDFVIVGNMLYAINHGNIGDCLQVVGSFRGCELIAYDISSSTNPIFRAGRDSSGDDANNSEREFYTISFANNHLYIGTEENGVGCLASPGLAFGCELIVFNIASATNPVLANARDLSGSSNGISLSIDYTTSAVSGNYLYLGTSGSTIGCSQTVGSGQGCELMVYNITTPNVPTYVAGRDISGGTTGTSSAAVDSMTIVGNYLYLTKSGDGTACSQTAGLAIGCELLIFDIASGTNPVYIGGRDVTGTFFGTGNLGMTGITVSGSKLYIGTVGNSSLCEQGQGVTLGCELMVFDISSLTSPVYVAGIDADGSYSGTSAVTVNELQVFGNSLYVTKAGNATACSQVAGASAGCELMVFYLSSTSNPFYYGGSDVSGLATGTGSSSIETLATRNNFLYQGKVGNATDCSQTAGSAIGCELSVTTLSPGPRGLVQGLLTGANNLGDVSSEGGVIFSNTASTSNLSIVTNSVVTAPALITIAGDYTNNGTYQTPSQGTVWFDSAAVQNLSGTMTGTSSFQNIVFSGSGTKTVAQNATATTITITAGATVAAPVAVTLTEDYLNNGTFIADGGTIQTAPQFQELLTVRDVTGGVFNTGDVAITNYARKGTTLYVAKDGGVTCGGTVSDSQGCELMVYDVSVSASPVFRTGREASGEASGSSVVAIKALAVVGNYLYAGKAANATACSQTAGLADGCELVVFDISSSTNPIYVAGRDAGGSSDGSVGTAGISALRVSGDYLYVAKEGDATACSQVAGSAIGCELMVFSIASGTNPVYVAGLDGAGGATDATSMTMTALSILENNLYATKLGDATACSQVAGSAIGCELMVFSIASGTNPVYVAGLDAGGSADGSGSTTITAVSADSFNLYVAKEGNATACSQVAGSAIGCEVLVFDISSTTHPVYRAGRDSSGSGSGSENMTVTSLSSFGNKLYLGKVGSTTACSNMVGLAAGCELMVFDLASTTNPTYIVGQDVMGVANSTGSTTINTVFAAATTLYVGKAGNSTFCSLSIGQAIGCEMMVYDIGSEFSGNLTGTSALAGMVTFGPTMFNGNASTSRITITPGSVLAAPTATLSLSGDFSNSGDFDAREGIVDLIGSNQTLSSTGATIFHNLTKITTAPAVTTFSATGSFETTGTLELRGTTTAPQLLRSSNDGQQWKILPRATTSVSWVDVKDSFNRASTVINCTDFCSSSGNNTGWFFSAATLGSGSSTLANHSLGQVVNAFSAQSKIDSALLRFRLIPNSGAATVNSVTVNLTGVTNIESLDFSDIRLIRDINSDGLIDGGDLILGGNGVLTITDRSGTLVFNESFIATSSANYLIVADWIAPTNGSYMAMTLTPNGILASDNTGLQSVFASSTIYVQHNRNNKGGGGANSSVGAPAPQGDGVVGGGTVGGGEQIGSDPDFFWPTSNSGGWITGANAYDQTDGTYATTSSVANHNYATIGFGVPENNVVSGIEVKLELSGTTAAGSAQVELSWDGGVSWTSPKNTPTLTTSDAVRTLGSPSDVWGRAWIPTEFSNANFAVRIGGNPSSNTVRLDAIQVRVYHVSGGGGSGGGGGI